MNDHDGMPTLAFGPFRLVRGRRQLFEGERPVDLGGRCFDLLVALVERAGEVVDKRALTACAWPGSHVEESSLRVQITALRKALGDGQAGRRYIANVPSRGYSFVAPVTALGAAAVVPPVPAGGAAPVSRLPVRLGRVIGRDAVLGLLAAQLAQRRLLTVAGPGGIGKSTVAVAAARRWADAAGGLAWFAEVGAHPGPDGLCSAVAAAIGLDPAAHATPAALAAALGNRPALLVLDNCEHLIDAAARFVVDLLCAAPALRILATSREPLRCEAETVHRLSPLTLPPADAPLGAAQALQYAAIELFVERALESDQAFVLDVASLPAVTGLCRRADGIPLAIETLAAQLGASALDELAARLDDAVLLRLQGRRTAAPRHRSLHAVVAWSHALLRDTERQLLGGLAALPGGFTPDAALAAAADIGFAAADAWATLIALVDKSLVQADTRGPAARYHLLGMTRAHALEQAGA